MSTHQSGLGVMRVFGIASESKIISEGSNNQFTGYKRRAVFTIRIIKSKLDAPIKRVGFMGIDNDQPVQKEAPPSAEYRDVSFWDFSFELHRSIVWVEEFHRIKGSFFVETTNNTYYWLKDRGEMELNTANNSYYYYPDGKGEKDFEFDGYSRFVLTDYDPAYALS